MLLRIRNFTFLFPLFFFHFLCSCTQRPLFYVYQHVNPDSWSVGDTLRFTPQPIPSEGTYTIALGVRANNRIDHRDLWLVLEQRTDGSRRRDTLHIPLAADNGNWLGQGIILHSTESVAATSCLQQEQNLELLVYHIMAAQEVRGITEKKICT